MTVENESGIFTWDTPGTLLEFQPMEILPAKGPYDNPRIQSLHIPLGVVSIGHDGWASMAGDSIETLEGFEVEEDILLPETLVCLGAMGLLGCRCTRLILPKSLRVLGGGAVMHCRIKELVIPWGLPRPKRGADRTSDTVYCYGRQFKESFIERLVMPPMYPYEDMLWETSEIKEIHPYKK